MNNVHGPTDVSPSEPNCRVRLIIATYAYHMIVTMILIVRITLVRNRVSEYARHPRLAKRSDKRRVYIAPFRRFHALRAATSDAGAG